MSSTYQAMMNVEDDELVLPKNEPVVSNKYDRVIKGKNDNTTTVDVYDVLKAFNVTNPALQHLIKKALCVGIRGHKDTSTDLQDIIDSAVRAKELS